MFVHQVEALHHQVKQPVPWGLTLALFSQTFQNFFIKATLELGKKLRFVLELLVDLRKRQVRFFGNSAERSIFPAGFSGKRESRFQNYLLSVFFVLFVRHGCFLFIRVLLLSSPASEAKLSVVRGSGFIYVWRFLAPLRFQTPAVQA